MRQASFCCKLMTQTALCFLGYFRLSLTLSFSPHPLLIPLFTPLVILPFNLMRLCKHPFLINLAALPLMFCGLTALAADKPGSAAEKQAPLSQNAPAAAAAKENAMNKDELRSKLSPLQYDVTCNAATEPAFRNAYWDNHAQGLYVDVIDGEPLFASNHKFDSGTGWPSFFQPVNKGSIIEKEDRTHGMIRVEVISAKSGAHLGHLFPDGPRPTGMRYCINSASLRFIPVADLEKAGYGKLQPLFQEAAPVKEGAAAKK